MIKIKEVLTYLISGILFINFFYFFIPVEIASADGNTLHVGSGQIYTSIQDAINAANESDTIIVHSGTYSETITVGKTLTITGEGSSSSTISGSGDHTLKISSNNVIISGFKIQNSGGSYYCFFLDSVTGCEISDNIIRNGGHGIYLGGSNSNNIEDNTIEDNNVGIYLSNSDSNTIKINNIQSNNANGIFLTSSSSNNKIYLNDFTNNLDSNGKDYGSNDWDYNSQGNYWDDYNDYDSNEDGIGDNPYEISGGSNQDNYPLGDFLSENQEPVAYIDYISPNPAVQGQTVNFNGRGVDDGTIMSWQWKSDGATISNNEDFSTSSLSVGIHTIKFRVQDDDEQWSDYKIATLTINEAANQKPNAYILQPTIPTADYGDDVRFEAYGADSDGTIVGYSWRSDPEKIISEEKTFTIDDLSVGEHTIYLKVRDDDGVWSSEVSTTLTIVSDAPENQAPVADSGGPYSGKINQSVIFDASASYDPDSGDTITYSWDFGDGETSEEIFPTHSYTSEGEYKVKLTVTDNHGAQSKISTSVIISQNGNNNNDQNQDNSEKNKSPGFELIFLIFGLTIFLFIKKKKN
jgi:parallel beta-helix repeat protein